jgi:poly-gamma-glutamate synthesis protein (capsule biosynthesis protein)
MTTSETVTLLGTGDVGPVHGPADGFPVEEYTSLIRDTLRSVDVRFGNCERQYSTRGTASERSPHGRQPPEMARIFDDCGFEAVTIANNHMYDYGPDALLDTRELLVSKGIAPTGAGRDLAEACQPAIVRSKGLSIGFLGFCSVLPEGGAAARNKVGIAPLRVNTQYEPRGPHAPVRVLTEADPDDLARIVDGVRDLKRQVDVVIVAFHWGAIWLPRIICDYQVEVAHACIDAGADAILGHHPHLPKAIEMYAGSPIFYSLSNFCMTKPFPGKPWAELPWQHGALRNHADQDPNYPLLPYGSNAKRSLLAKLTLSKSGVEEASFLPVMIDTRYRPEPLRAGDPRFDDLVGFMEWTSEGFDHDFEVVGDEVRIRSHD